MTPPTGSRTRALSVEALRVSSAEALKEEEGENDAEDKSSDASPSSWCDGEAERASREAAQISR